ncbi:hypothetical protein [Desulfoferrobacter suflitae]|uniref:hypothetical protein n=1 Tax=Desulfoferrobacter suflitae TaxID=2865782 RepID=UPI00216406FA|nr:hypothetical protein [Desulfoferrobacter suflitae]MCK8601630.1 hypothetical protein [Desulfoferrobacter suflitae]
MADKNKVQAVVDYLRAEFPQSNIEDWPVAANQTHFFRITDEKSSFQTEVFESFLAQHDAASIADRLRKFTLAEHLRELPTHVVLVTEVGLKLDYE